MDRLSENAREQQYDEFVALLARHDLAIRRIVRFLLPWRDGVDDVMQETALECWKKFSDFQPARSEDAAGEFVRWACVIARFKVLSWQRDKARDRLVFRERVIKQLSHAALDSLSQRDEERQAVEVCLEKLPADQRRLVLSVHTPSESIARRAAETGEKARRLYSKVNALRRMLLDCVQRQLAGEVDDNIRDLILQAIDETISEQDFERLQDAIEQDDISGAWLRRRRRRSVRGRPSVVVGPD